MSLLQTGISLLMEPRAVPALAAASRRPLVYSLSTASASRLVLCRTQTPLFAKAELFLRFEGFLAFFENLGNEFLFFFQHGKEILFSSFANCAFVCLFLMLFKLGTKIKVFQIIVKLISKGFGVNVSFDSIGILCFS